MGERPRYFQCRLVRSNNTSLQTTGWIEARGAKVGAQVELLPSKEWWTVAEVFDHGLPEEMLREYQRMHRKSLPSIVGN